MISEQRGLASARRVRVGCVCACICMSALLANLARGESVPVSSYDQWQMNGFTRSPFVPTVTIGGTTSANAVSMYSRANSQAVVPMVSSLAETVAAASTFETGTASLSGFVYCDYDNDGKRTANDWGIAEATVSLSLSGSSDPPLTVLTARDGSYTFINLATGSYTVKVLTPSSSPDAPSPGFVMDTKGNVVPDVEGTAANLTTIANVQLAAGDNAVNYDFPQAEYPVQLLSKRMLLNTDPGTPHTPPSPPVPVPEPGTLALLLVAGLLLRRFRRVRA
jgi:hypothetical protein